MSTQAIQTRVIEPPSNLRERPDDAALFKRTIVDNTNYRVVTWYENQMAFFEALRCICPQ